MKRILLSVVLVLVIVLGMSACGKADDVGSAASVGSSTDEGSALNNSVPPAKPPVTVVNPVTIITEKEAKDIYEDIFNVPKGALNIKWSKLENSDSSAASNQPLVQFDFKLDRLEFNAREEKTGKTEEYSHGMNYEWTAQDTFRFENKNGTELSGTYYRFIGTDEYADLCTWYDPDRGMSYSVSVTDKTLDGFDLLAVVMEITP